MSPSSVLGITDYVIIGLMLAVSACMGFYFRFTGGKQKTMSEFLMANKNMSVGPVAFSIMATDISATSVLGIAAEMYMFGCQLVMWTVTLPFCALFSACGILPVYFNMEFSTAYEYLEKRYGKTARSVASAFFILRMGGLKAVLWTDVFQAILMYIAILAVFIGASIHLGSVGELFRVANKGGRLIFFNMSPSPTERYTFWTVMATGVVYVFDNHVANQTTVQRLLSVGSLKQARKALFWSVPLILTFSVLVCLNGVAVYSIYHDCDPMQQPGKKLSSPDQLVPYAILNMFGSTPGLSGLCIAGIFSASLSTISSALNSVTVVVIEDFIRPFCTCKRLTEAWMTFLAKILAVAFGILCMLLIVVVANFKGVLEASFILSGMVRGPALGMYILGMFTMTTNEPGMLIGVLTGFTINAWMGFGYYAAKIKSPSLPRSVAGCAAVANVTSYFTTSPDNTTLFELESVADKLSLTAGEEKYVFPLYRVSYMLFPVISTAITILVGYLASRIIGIWKKYPDVDPKCLSPFVRKWYSGYSEAPTSEKVYDMVPLNSNADSEVTHFDLGRQL